MPLPPRSHAHRVTSTCKLPFPTLARFHSGSFFGSFSAFLVWFALLSLIAGTFSLFWVHHPDPITYSLGSKDRMEAYFILITVFYQTVHIICLEHEDHSVGANCHYPRWRFVFTCIYYYVRVPNEWCI